MQIQRYAAPSGLVFPIPLTQGDAPLPRRLPWAEISWPFRPYGNGLAIFYYWVQHCQCSVPRAALVVGCPWTRGARAANGKGCPWHTSWAKLDSII